MLKEIQAQVTEFLPIDGNSKNEIIKVKKPQKFFLSNFYSGTKKQSQIISDLRRLLSWKESPNDTIITENCSIEPDILDIYGPNILMTNLVQANGKYRNKRIQRPNLTNFDVSQFQKNF